MPSKFDSDPEPVFNMAYGLKLNHKKMRKLEKEYTTMKTKEKEDEIELRVRLQSRNLGQLPNFSFLMLQFDYRWMAERLLYIINFKVAIHW